MEASRVVLSIVSPVYQAAGSIIELVHRITIATQRITDNFEIILVDDRSEDNSWEKILETVKVNPRVRAARLSRNFGQHAALTAALALARGDYIIAMDCDLQHAPEDIPLLWAKAAEGYDIVLARTGPRCHAAHRNLGAWAFQALNTFASGKKQIDTNIGTYSLISRKVADAFLRLPEQQRHYLHILRWMGFSVGYVDVEHRERPTGTSSYTIAKLINHALQGSVSQSQRLLHYALGLGVGYVVAAFLAAVAIVIRWYTFGLREGWASVIVLILGSAGFILLTLGVLGLYIGAILEQVRGRPLYLIDEIKDSKQ
jgi:glycosyltransferase involved in cell wall biosynthesis